MYSQMLVKTLSCQQGTRLAWHTYQSTRTLSLINRTTTSLSLSPTNTCLSIVSSTHRPHSSAHSSADFTRPDWQRSLRNSIILPHSSFSTHAVLKIKIKDEATRKKESEDMRNKLLLDGIFTIPNFLSCSRILASLWFAPLISMGAWQSALVIFIYAGFTDWLDGFIARKFPSQRSVLGTVLDPVADKILILVSTASLAMGGFIPGFLACLIFGKDVVMLAAGAALRYKTLDKPVTTKKFFDMKVQTMEIKPLNISKLNTFLQFTTLATSLAAPLYGFWGHPVLPILWYSTGFTTIATAVSYAVTKDAYEIKKPPNKQPPNKKLR